MIKSLFNKKKEDESREVKVELPEDEYVLLEWKEKDLPCIAMVNIGIRGFEPKEIFCWHLSVIIDFDELIENGMPSIEEREVVEPFCDKLEKEICAGGNALFLARETWNGTRQLVWRVYDPEIANDHLQFIIKQNLYPRQFDFHMEEDFDWEKAQWYYDAIKT